MKRLLLLGILLLLAITLGAATASQFYFATDEELRDMAALRGLEGGSREEMLSSLYSYEGLEAYQEDLGEEDDFSLSILSAESVRSKDGIVLITGNGSLSFTSGDGKSSLSADTVILDTENRTLVALENVLYNTESKSSLSSIEADIVSLFWEGGTVRVSNAVTSITQEDEDGNNVSFYTSGDLLTYAPSGAMVYENGTVALSPKDPHSSFSASRIAMLPGSDLFFSNAVLKIGRVPVFWFPFLFFPGTQITGNPAFGLSSEKGMFLNTTWELFGSAGLVDDSGTGASIMSIAKGDTDGDLFPDGSYYASGEPGRLQRWAIDSSSYLALMGDAYQEGGLNFGVKGKLNFLDKKLTVEFYDGIAVSEANESYGYDNLRYYGKNELSYSDHGLTLEGSFPFYSDSQVLMDYGNRVSSFSVMSLLEAPEFPEDYTSSVTTFHRTASLSYTMPSKLKTQYVSSLKISALDIDYAYRWSSSNLEYYLKEVTLPSFNMTLSGSLLKLSATPGSGGIAVEKTEVDVTDEYILQDPLLYSLYKKEASSKSKTSSSSKTYDLELKYTFTEVLSNEYDYDSSGDMTDQEFSSTSSLKLNLVANAADYASLEAIFTPSFYYLYEDDDGALAMTERGTVTTDITFGIPIAGLEYRIAGKLLSITDYTEGNVSQTTVFHPGWDEDTITTHYVSFSKAFATDSYGTLTPSLKYILPPLESSIVPGLTYTYSNFKLVFEWEFLENDDGGYDADLAKLSLSWNSTHFTSSMSLKYESSEYDSSDFLIPLYGTASFSLRTADKLWSVTEYVDWEYLSDDGYKNYFNHLKTTFKIPYFQLVLDWQGPADDLSFYSIDWDLDIEGKKFQLWKGRLYFALGFEASFSMEIEDPYSATLDLTPSITFSIAEFLDFKFSFSSENNGFYEYYKDDKFSFKEMLKDFGQSLDFFGNGRKETNFVFSTASLEITHYMHDWDLNVKYSAVVDLVNDSYQFIPELTIYLRWKILPDLKIDQTWEEEDGKWTQD